MKAIREAILLLLLAVVLGGVTQWIYPKPVQTREIAHDADALTIDDVSRLSTPIRWIDARSKAAYEAGHIPAALLLNEDSWEQLLPDLIASYAPDMTLVVYCDSNQCDASKQVARRLREEIGLHNVFTLEGGWQAWKAHAAEKR